MDFEITFNVKECGTCKKIKSVREFTTDLRLEDGKRSSCKECVNPRGNENRKYKRMINNKNKKK